MTWLYVLVVIFILIVAILYSPVRVNGEYSDEKIYLFAKWFFVRYDVYPVDKRKKQKRRKKTEKRIQRKSHTKGKISSILFLKIMALTIIELGKCAVVVLRNANFKKFDLEVLVGGEDAAEAAMTYGEICSFVYPTLGLLHSVSKMKNPKINVFTDYDKKDVDVKFVFSVNIPLIILVVSRFKILTGAINNAI